MYAKNCIFVKYLKKLNLAVNGLISIWLIHFITGIGPVSGNFHRRLAKIKGCLWKVRHNITPTGYFIIRLWETKLHLYFSGRDGQIIREPPLFSWSDTRVMGTESRRRTPLNKASQAIWLIKRAWWVKLIGLICSSSDHIHTWPDHYGHHARMQI